MDTSIPSSEGNTDGAPGHPGPSDAAAEVVRRLHPDHLADLRASGLSDDTIVANDYRNVGPAGTGHYLRRTGTAFAEKLGVCLAIPFYDAAGELMPCIDRATGKPLVGKNGRPTAYVRLKPLAENRRARDGKAVKYESAFGVRNRAYFPARTRAKLADPTVPLVIVEGEKQAAKGDQEGFACIGLVGVYGWLVPRPKGSDGKGVGEYRLMDDLANIPWKDRKVFIVFDSDLADNPNVQWAEYRLAQALRKLGADVRVVRLPGGPNGGKVGLDDYLKAYGKEAFDELLAAARRPRKPGTKPRRRKLVAREGGGPGAGDAGGLKAADGTTLHGVQMVGDKLLVPIVINTLQYAEVEDLALEALTAHNSPPRIFVGNGAFLALLHRPEPGEPLAVRRLDAASLRPILARVATWHKQTDDGQKPDFPPPALLASLPARTEWPGIPYLRAIISYPAYGKNWQLVVSQGYHVGTGIYCDLNGLEIPPLPDVPTPEQVDEAKRWIIEELLFDFPFADDKGASRANAVAILILAVVRNAIDGPTPLGVIDAPTEGTGKSLLAEVIALITVGEMPMAISPDMPDDEWRKMLLALLMEGQAITFLDNANRKLDSGALASALTAPFIKGRILGETRMVRAKVNTCWVLTANNLTCSREIARRCYWTRIDARVATPSTRTNFRNPKLIQWVKENRPRLLWSVLVLVQNWRASGGQWGTATLGKFEEWAGVMSGILEAAGISGFLGNADAFRARAADQVGELAEFVEAWQKLYPTEAKIAGDLYGIALGTLDSVLTAPSDHGRRKQLGGFLVKQIDRVVGEYRITVAGADHSKRPRYKLEPAVEKATDTDSDEMEVVA